MIARPWLPVARLLESAARVARRTIPAARDPRDPAELCCVAARLLCVDLYGADRVDRAPLADWHLWSTARPWSPVEAAIAAGVAEGPIDERATPGPGVWLVQVWRGAGPTGGGTGHTLVWIGGADGAGWQLDGVEGRAYDLRVRSWTEVVADGRWGVRAARLLAP